MAAGGHECAGKNRYCEQHLFFTLDTSVFTKGAVFFSLNAGDTESLSRCNYSNWFLGDFVAIRLAGRAIARTG